MPEIRVELKMYFFCFPRFNKFKGKRKIYFKSVRHSKLFCCKNTMTYVQAFSQSYKNLFVIVQIRKSVDLI